MTHRGTALIGPERRATSDRSALRQDLSAGLCIGVPDFTERPAAMQYAACLQCPVLALCPAATPWPKGVCCKRGHVGEMGNNRQCKVCERDRHRGTRTPPNVTLEALGEVGADKQQQAQQARATLAWVRRMRQRKQLWATIVADLGMSAEAIAEQLDAAGAPQLAASLRVAPVYAGPARVGNPPSAYVELAERGLSMPAIATQLGVQARSVEKALYRAGRGDLARRARPARLVRGSNQYVRRSA